MKALTTLFVIGMLATTVAMADDVDDVKAAMKGYFAALNAGDWNALSRYRMPAHSNFGRGGTLLVSSTSLAEQRNFFPPVTAGLKFNFQLRHVEVKVYGNTAIVTGYLVGTTTSPDGTTSQLSDRRTGVMIKQGGQWREAHFQPSPLNTP